LLPLQSYERAINFFCFSYTFSSSSHLVSLSQGIVKASACSRRYCGETLPHYCRIVSLFSGQEPASIAVIGQALITGIGCWTLFKTVAKVKESATLETRYPNRS
jgi:hypothetical protein